MGTVVISVDAELGWGFHDRERVPTERVEAARDGWRRLLALFATYRTPATWAVVGHLLLSDCDGRHADHPTPPGWFARERGAWHDRPDLRFGGDLVDDLLDAAPDHDVGSHTFSHVVASDPRVSRDVLRADVAAGVEIADDHGIDVDSFVFPRNAVGHRDLLAEVGVRTYRGPRRLPPPGPRRALAKLGMAADADRVPLVEPRVDEHGLVEIPPSLYLFGFEGAPNEMVTTAWKDPMLAAARNGIDRAAREDGVFHLWFHPNDVVTDRDADRVERVLSHLDRRRAETDLTVETMRDVADRMA
jgi:peptidoglycan/xylan/chitin deacetylase (PgdA/CDA1 family)